VCTRIFLSEPRKFGGGIRDTLYGLGQAIKVCAVSEMSVSSTAEKIIFELHAACRAGLIGRCQPRGIVETQDSQDEYQYTKKEHQTGLFSVDLITKNSLDIVDIQYFFSVKSNIK
jgi:hypothetical protein